MASEAKMEHNRALLRGNMEQAKTCVEQLAAVDESEAQYRYAIQAGFDLCLLKLNTTSSLETVQMFLVGTTSPAALIKNLFARTESSTDDVLTISRPLMEQKRHHCGHNESPLSIDQGANSSGEPTIIQGELTKGELSVFGRKFPSTLSLIRTPHVELNAEWV